MLGHISRKSLWSAALNLSILGPVGTVKREEMAGFCENAPRANAVLLDLTMSGEVRIVFLVAPNGSERSEKLGSRKHGAKHLSKACEILVCA